jgi:hypothetical protein
MLKINVFKVMLFTFVLSSFTGLIAQEQSDVAVKEEAESVVNDFGNFGVIGFHKLTLKDSTQTESFELFVKKEFIPQFNSIFPGEKLLIAKGNRGPESGKYTLLFLFDTLKRRNDYIPDPNRMSEEAVRLWEASGSQPVWDKLWEYVDSEFIADYVVIE